MLYILLFLAINSLYGMEQQSHAASSSQKILVFYKTDPHCLSTIKETGLHGYSQTTDDEKAVLGIRQINHHWDDSICFSLFLDKSHNKDNTVGYLVDPLKTRVYNAKYRAEGDYHRYWENSIRLKKYLELKQKERLMVRKIAQDQFVIVDKKTAEPYYVSLDFVGEQNQFEPEVRLYRKDIPVCDAMIFFDERN